MSKLANVFVRPTWNKGALAIGVAQYHLTRALLNSWVRLEVKKPRWGSSNKCYPVIQKNGWFEMKQPIQIDDLSVLPFEETSGSEGTIRRKALHILEDFGVNINDFSYQHPPP
jgi:hypothetical protein